LFDGDLTKKSLSYRTKWVNHHSDVILNF
jgi:hypothetical protein